MHNIPRLVRWLVVLAVFFFVLMSALRLGTLFYFAPPGMSLGRAASSFWMGFRYDAREIGGLCLLLFILGIIRPIDPFRTKAGRALMFSVIAVFLAALIIFYVADYLHFRYLLQ